VEVPKNVWHGKYFDKKLEMHAISQRPPNIAPHKNTNDKIEE